MTYAASRRPGKVGLLVGSTLNVPPWKLMKAAVPGVAFAEMGNRQVSSVDWAGDTNAAPVGLGLWVTIAGCAQAPVRASVVAATRTRNPMHVQPAPNIERYDRWALRRSRRIRVPIFPDDFPSPKPSFRTS